MLPDLDLSNRTICSRLLAPFWGRYSLSCSSPAHLAEEVHDFLTAARAALVSTSALVRIFELPVLLELATTLFWLATHALRVLRARRLRSVRLYWCHLLASLAIVRMLAVRSVRRLAWVGLSRVGELVIANRSLVGVVELRLLRRCRRWARRAMRVGAGVGVANARVAVLLAIVEPRYGVAAHCALTRRTGFIATTERHAGARVVAGSAGIRSAALTVAIGRHAFSLRAKILREGRGQQGKTTRWFGAIICVLARKTEGWAASGVGAGSWS